jgi:hypothetical protein
MAADQKYECKFATYCPSHSGQGDLHVVKEVIHHPDGTTEPHLRFLRNFKRKFWVTKPGFRTHKFKRDCEEIVNCNEFTATQSGLERAAKAALQKAWSKEHFRELCNDPYLYGVDIDSTALVKQAYHKKYPIPPSPYTVAVYDVETDVLHGTEEVIISTLSYKHRVRTAVKASFVKGYADVINRLQALAEQYLGDILKERNITIEFTVEDDEIATAFKPIQKAHEWKPDFVTGWNLLYDVRCLEKAADKAGIDIKTLMNDPGVPDDHKLWKVKEGPAKRVTASGVVMSFIPAQRWHTFYNPASFYLVDAMSTYYYVRQGAQAESSYALDHILKQKIGRGKLKFTQADAYQKLKWHQYMQQHHPLEYVIYNIFDCVSIELLDERTKDLAVLMPLYSGYSDFSRFKSQPRRLCDDYHFAYQKHGKVFASTGSEMVEPGDDEVVGVDGHVITLDAGRVADNGLQCIEEDPTLHTNIRIGQADNDVSSSYPSNQVCLNVSRSTTVKELIKIEGIDEDTKRMMALGLPSGHNNAVEFCTTLLNLPQLTDLLASFEKELEKT